MNKKGFTLIELLAVIVILAIIALITAPIVVNIITSSRESANRISATNYISAVNESITKAAIENIIVENGYYEITNDGNICLEELNNNKCTGEKLKINTSGNRPINGTITIENETVVSGVVSYDGFSVELIEGGQIEYSPFTLKYRIGEEVSINMGSNFGILKFNVIDEDEDTITLLSQAVLGQSEWITYVDHNNYIKSSETCGSYRCMFLGPITPFKMFNAGLGDLSDLIIKDYEYINNNLANNNREYKKITIKNGITTLTDYQGNNNVMPGSSVARLLTAEEYLEIASRYNKNFTYENLKKLVIEKLDVVNDSLKLNCATLEEFLDAVEMEDDWLSIYLLSTLAISEYFNTLDEEELSKYSVPEWLGINSGEYWTSSTITLGGSTSFIYNISQVLLPSGNVFTVMLTDQYATNSKGIRPVITIDKNSKRIQ